MIWATAKLTDVRRRQTPRPSRLSGFRSASRAEAAHVTDGVTIGAS
jgi:hypothetical protein